MVAAMSTDALRARIDDYLQAGGLFNPEMMNHEKVRTLLMDCRAALAASASETEKLPAKWRSEEWCASTMTDDRPAEEICASELEAALKADRHGVGAPTSTK